MGLDALRMTFLSWRLLQYKIPLAGNDQADGDPPIGTVVQLLYADTGVQSSIVKHMDGQYKKPRLHLN
jgi:hypothetical protein